MPHWPSNNANARCSPTQPPPGAVPSQPKVREAEACHGLPPLPPVRKPAFVRHLGAVDVHALQRATRRVSEDMWQREDSAKENDYFCFDHTHHIVFRFIAGNSHPMRFYTNPIWTPWQGLLLPVLRAATAAYGFASAVYPKVMLARLAAGRGIAPHEDGEGSHPLTHRIHVPLQTSPEVVFTVGGQRHHLAAGHAWETNNIVAHSVFNGSPAPRIHLVFEAFDGACADSGCRSGPSI